MKRAGALPADNTLKDDPQTVGVLERFELALPTDPCNGGNFRPDWQAFYFYPPTVYVTPRRPRKLPTRIYVFPPASIPSIV